MAETAEVSSAEKTAGCVIGLVTLPLYMTFSGYVTASLWRWFAVPLFPALPILTVPRAIGLMLVLTCFKRVPKTSKNDGFALLGEQFSNGFVWPGLLLLTGWIVQRCFL